jgi:hypothetical protein
MVLFRSSNILGGKYTFFSKVLGPDMNLIILSTAC